MRRAYTPGEFLEDLPALLEQTRRYHPNNPQGRERLRIRWRTVQFVCRSCAGPLRIATLTLLAEAMGIRQRGFSPFDWQHYPCLGLDITHSLGSHSDSMQCDACRAARRT